MDRIQHIGTLVKMNLYFVFYAIFPPHIFPAEGGADMRKLLLTGCGLVLALYLLPVFWPSEEAEPFTVPSAAATGAAAAPAGDYTTVTV